MLAGVEKPSKHQTSTMRAQQNLHKMLSFVQRRCKVSYQEVCCTRMNFQMMEDPSFYLANPMEG